MIPCAALVVAGTFQNDCTSLIHNIAHCHTGVKNEIPDMESAVPLGL